MGSQGSVAVGDADVVEVFECSGILNCEICHVEQVDVLNVKVFEGLETLPQQSSKVKHKNMISSTAYEEMVDGRWEFWRS